jgi:asparagine synthase (glutamine-hydrolysing)
VSDVTDLWWTSTFEGLDPGATQRAVELRYPFFDVRLASFTLRLPSFPWCVNKHVLRTAMNGRLPDLVRTRPKTPLITSPLGPRGRWPTARALELFESTPEVARFVDVRKFRTMVKSDSLLSSETPAAWAAISLAMWLRGEVAAPAFDAR